MTQQPPVPPTDDSIDLQTQLAAAQAEVARLKDMAGRAQADLQNAKERLKREREEVGMFAAEKFLLSILPTLDGFQRAMTHLPPELKDNEWVKGMMATEKDLMNRLGDMGLTRFAHVGEKADPAIEDIILAGPGEEGVVTDVLEDGYKLYDKVLRPAKVKVGDGTTPA